MARKLGMLRRRAWLLAGLLLMSVGCATDEKAPRSTWMTNLGNLWGAPGVDSAQLEIATLRAAPGDAFIERDVWLEVNEQALPMEQRPNLHANGLRIGVTNGALPPALKERLGTRDATIRRITIKGGQEHFLTLSNADRAVAFDVQQESELVPVSF